jgi:hypothetical protein
MADLSHGVKATIIDFGLSRMEINSTSRMARQHRYDRPQGMQWTVFDETIFQGEGNLHSIVGTWAFIRRIGLQ